MSNDKHGDRMKLYEQIEAGRTLMPLLPICIRIDGKSFHSWTKDLCRPYDIRMSNLMIDTTKFLVEKINAKIGYCQSDEISLIIYSDNIESQTFFNGKIQKLTSVISSMATAFFNMNVKKHFKEERQLAFFDCRVWNVPNKTEAANTILWREFDASKNSVSMAARAAFSHKEIHGKTSKEMQEMLFTQCDVNWNDYPAFFKRGTFVQRKLVKRQLTEEDKKQIPEKYWTDMVERSEVTILELPKFSSILNRTEVIFNGEQPQLCDA